MHGQSSPRGADDFSTVENTPKLVSPGIRRRQIDRSQLLIAGDSHCTSMRITILSITGPPATVHMQDQQYRVCDVVVASLTVLLLLGGLDGGVERTHILERTHAGHRTVRISTYTLQGELSAHREWLRCGNCCAVLLQLLCYRPDFVP